MQTSDFVRITPVRIFFCFGCLRLEDHFMDLILGFNNFLVDLCIHLLTFLPFGFKPVNDVGQFMSSGICLLLQELFGDVVLQFLQPLTLVDESPLVLGWLDGSNPFLLQIVGPPLILVQDALHLHELHVVV